MNKKSLHDEADRLIFESGLLDGKNAVLQRDNNYFMAISDSFKIKTSKITNGLKVNLCEFEKIFKKIDLEVNDRYFDLTFSDLPKYSNDFVQKTEIKYSKDLDDRLQFLYNEKFGIDTWGLIRIGKIGVHGQIEIKTSDNGYDDCREIPASLLEDYKSGFRKNKVIQYRIDTALRFTGLMIPGMEEFLEDNFPLLIEDGDDGYNFYKCYGNTVVNDIYRFNENEKVKKLYKVIR